MDLESRLQHALMEDAPTGDITSQLFLETISSTSVTAQIIAKENGVFSGAAVVHAITNLESVPGLESLDVDVINCCEDGTALSVGDVAVELTGPTQHILIIERVLLNLLQRLSGVATVTHRFVSALNNSRIQLLDTRKTTPLWRDLEKKAVRDGGGANHRFGLSDMILIKENHINAFLASHNESELDAYLKSIKKTHPDIKIEIEIENNQQLEAFDLSAVDYIMLDNYRHDDIETACALIKEKGWSAEVEISGNVSLENISGYSYLPIHRISVGSLTHSVKALDLSLLLS
jgi:nicotinate-nucleotide pyrophosphorylase (carboxylating)